MSEKPFENYLVDKFSEWAEPRARPGFRYQFRSPDRENSRRLFEAFKTYCDHILRDAETELPAFSLGPLKIVPVLHGSESGACSENYISHLRDCVASQTGEFSGSCLLIIHDSLLDTLINSAHDLGAPGSVWHPAYLKEHLHTLLGTDKLSGLLLDDQFGVMEAEGATVFGLRPIYKALEDGKLDFWEIGLFDDPLLREMTQTEAQIRRRIEDNRKLRERIEFEVENFSGQLEEQLGRLELGDRFIQQNFAKDDWRKVPFSTYLEEIEKNKNQMLRFVEATCDGACEVILRPRSLSKAGQRDLSILLLYDPGVSKLELHLKFEGSRLEDKEFRLQRKPQGTEFQLRRRGSGTRICVELPNTEMPGFLQASLNRPRAAECFKFRVVTLLSTLLEVEDIKNCFQVEPRHARILLQKEENTLRLRAEGDRVFTVAEPNEIVASAQFDLIDFDQFAADSDLVTFSVENDGCRVGFSVEGPDTTGSLPVPFLFSRSQRLFEDGHDVEYSSARSRLVFENSEFKLVGVRHQLLKREYELVEDGVVADLPEGRINLERLAEIDGELGRCYRSLFGYYRENRTLPSLVAWGAQYRGIVALLVRRYGELLDAIPDDDVLSLGDRTLVQLGFLREPAGAERIAPFAPLTLAYFSELVTRVLKDDEDTLSSLPNVTQERLGPQGLIPYIYSSGTESEYQQILPLAENRFWLEATPRGRTGFSFVRRLVRDKIREFTRAYCGLFESRSRGTLRLNCVNQGYAHQILLGLLDYIRDNEERCLHLHVSLYDDRLSFTSFDRLAETRSNGELREWLGIDRERNPDLLIHLLRTRLSYSKFTHSTAQGYAHIAFFCNATPVSYGHYTIDTALSGVMADGLISGYAAERKGNSYFIGFGLRDVPTQAGGCLEIAKHLNAPMQPARKADTQYIEGHGYGLTVKTEFRKQLSQTCENSLWTTIIDPKVNLDFFAAEEDLILIHFSDQYTNSAGYDAITVTKQIALFSSLLDEEDNVTELNAFNGSWLLTMLTTNPNTRKERLGILGAYKFLYSLVSHRDVSWVPLSIAEVIRVSGNLGLDMSSDFARRVQGYSKGAISDDVLFVGFGAEEKLFVLPLEVKTGARPDFAKATQQALELARFFLVDVLGRPGITGQLYRALFVKQVLMQVEKYSLYGILTEGQLARLRSKRERWLTGNYEVGCVSDYPLGVVMAHIDSQSSYSPNYILDERVLRIEMPYSFLDKLVNSKLAETPEKIAEPFKPPQEYCLGLRHQVDLKSYEEAQQTSSKTESVSKKEEETVGVDGARSSEESAATQTECELESLATSKAPSELGLRVLLGHSLVGDQPLYWEPTNTNRFLNPNTAIIGTMGTGKTQFTKSLVTQLVRGHAANVGGEPVGILIFDYKSDYVDDQFSGATGAMRYKLHHLPYNPLSLHGTMPMLPLHTAGSFTDTMARAFRLGPKQKLKLREVTLQAYQLAGISKSDSSTWDRPAPTVERVWNLFLAQEKVEQDSLYAALSELAEYEIFETDPSKMASLYDLTRGVTVIELSGYSPDLQNLVVGLTLDLFYAQMQKSGKPKLQGNHRQLRKLVLVDEADNFMSQNFAALRKILKEGREYGVGVVLSTQDISHFKTSENDYTAYILTWVVHRVAQIRNVEIKTIFNVDEKADQSRLMEDVRRLEKHYSLFIDGEKNIQKMRDRAFFELLDLAPSGSLLHQHSGR